MDAAEGAFQSTLPARGATCAIWETKQARLRHFNPRSPHGERRRGGAVLCAVTSISIHAPRTGSDRKDADQWKEWAISIHAPRTGSDQIRRNDTERAGISIHAPRTGSDTVGSYATPEEAISIHAPRTGSDRCKRLTARFTAHFNPRSPHGERHAASLMVARAIQFQSTLPARGATAYNVLLRKGQNISIHAPRTGSDTPPAAAAHSCTYFNPRSPHGERPPPMTSVSPPSVFQSTLPARGATAGGRGADELLHISIHAPRTGSDTRTAWRTPPPFLFQSTLPARGATPSAGAAAPGRGISIHAPRTGSDRIASSPNAWRR